MRWMQKWQQKFSLWMQGRYGLDPFSRFLLYVGLALLLAGTLTQLSFFSWCALAVLLFSYFRICSRKFEPRSRENLVYMALMQRLRNQVALLRRRWGEQRTHKRFACPQCGQKLRVPRGKGKISITCPKCGRAFVKKT